MKTMDILASVCLLAILSSVLAEFYVSHDTTGWLLANTKCKLATPELHFTSDKITVDVNMDIDEEVWVGYYQASTQFEYIGCAAKRDIGTKITTKSDPGQCLSACNGHSVIGIYDKECYCLNDDFIERRGSDQTMFNTCTKKCGGDVNKIVCGGEKGGNQYISIYRSIGFDDSRELNMEWYCKYYDNKGFTWHDCAKDYRFFCEKGQNIWIETKNGAELFIHWKDATKLCFKNSSRPSTRKKTLGFPLESTAAQTWTGIVRSNAIYKIDGTSDDHLHANAFGFIKSENGKLEFETTAEQNKPLKRLCVKTTTTSPESSTTTPKMTTATTETSETKSTYELAKGNQQNESSNVGAIVGATLTIVILIVIAIAAVIYVRKWGFTLPSFLKKEKSEPPPSNANNNNAYVISRPVEILQSSYKTDTDNYAEIDLTTTSYNEGNKGGASGKTQEGDDEEEASPYSHDYFVLEKVDEGQYDTTKDADQNQIPKPNPNTFNPYNKLNFEQSSNYDHIGASKGANAKRHVSDSENTYNTTDTGDLKKSIGKTDNDYDTADGTEDDTYNHTNVQGHQKGLGTSENDYDAI